MKIQCPKCSVRFKSPDEAATPGRKFRCGVCKFIFTMDKAVQAPAAPPATPLPVQSAPDQENDLLSDLFAGADSLAAASSKTDDLADFLNEEPSAGADKKLTEQLDDDLEDLFKDKEDEFDPDSNKTSALEETDQPDDFDQFLRESQDDTGREEASAKARTEEEPEPYEAAKDGESAGGADKKKISGKTRLILRIIGLIILLFIIIAAGLYLYAPQYLLKGSGQPAVENNSAPAEPQQPSAAQAQPDQARNQINSMSLTNIRQYTINNSQAGLLYVIDGEAKNDASVPRSLARLEASLYDLSGKALYSKNFYAGITLPQKDLETKSAEEIEALLSDKAEIGKNNSYIEPGTSVKFMAVFAGVKEDVSEFGIKIISLKDLLPETPLDK